MPFLPIIWPPVGKSGPKIYFWRSEILQSGFLIRYKDASITSPKLCGAILVAIPTAIPDAPLTKRFGNWDGKTEGSFVVSS